MQDSFFRFGHFNQGSSDISRFGGGQQGTRVIRRVYVSNDPPTQLSTLDPFPTSRFPSIFPTMEPSMNVITRHRYYSDGFPLPFPSKEEPVPEETRRSYYPDEYYKPPPKANPPMMPGGHYDNEFSNYQPRHDPRGGNPVNLHLNLHLGPDDLRKLYPGNGNFNGQNGGGGYNPQVQGGNKVGGNGKITLGPDINGGNINIGGGKAGGGDVKGGKKDNKDDDSSDDDDDDDEEEDAK